MTTRKEIWSLTPGELFAYRQAVAKLQDSKYYQEIAGYHWIPRKFCEHGDLFLPWHRMYIRFFEIALQKIDPTVSIPYWDWTSAETMEKLVPAEFQEKVYSYSGTSYPNPLYSAYIPFEQRQTRRQSEFTTDIFGSATENVTAAYAMPEFLSFSQLCFEAHTTIHTYMGGDFPEMNYAAFDPIFWTHHATVDRQWAIWQNLYSQEGAYENIKELELKGFENTKVLNVLDYKSHLGYQYSTLVKEKSFSRSLAIVARFSDVRMQEKSFKIQVYVHKKNTSLEALAAYTGLFGTGKNGHSHHGHHAVNFLVDVTKATEKLGGTIRDWELEIRATDLAGNKAHYDELKIGHLSLEILKTDPAN